MLDTNVIVSGLGWGGVPGAVVDAAVDGRFELVTSLDLLDELRHVLQSPKLSAVIDDVEELIRLIGLIGGVVAPTERVQLARDPDDDRVIEAALASGADFIVTGDDDLLSLGAVGGIVITDARGFLALLTQPR